MSSSTPFFGFQNYLTKNGLYTYIVQYNTSNPHMDGQLWYGKPFCSLGFEVFKTHHSWLKAERHILAASLMAVVVVSM